MTVEVEEPPVCQCQCGCERPVEPDDDGDPWLDRVFATHCEQCVFRCLP